jgi:hypothetical protein
MNSTLKNTIAVITGLVLGRIINMEIIMSSSSTIPPPKNGVDVRLWKL